MSDPILIYGYGYDRNDSSQAQFDEFNRYASRKLPTSVSAWRVRIQDDPDDLLPFKIVVVDETAGASLEFAWDGVPLELPYELALSFLARRKSTQAQAFAAGHRGRLSDVRHYGEAIAPRVTEDGRWSFPDPQG